MQRAALRLRSIFPFLLAFLFHVPASVAQNLDTVTVWRMFEKPARDGWVKTDFYDPGDVVFADTAVILEEGMAMTGITWTEDFPRIDYEVTVEAMRVKGNDFFCGLTFPVRNEPCTLIIGGWGGSVVGLSSIDGLDASENMSGLSQRFENGRWYRIRLRVTQEAITAWIDDKEVVDVETEGRRFSIRPEVALSRPFGFATWYTTAALRNLEVRRLN